MFPELLKLGPVSIKTYGVFVAAGFIAALFYLAKRVGARGIPRETAMDFALYAMISGILGARLLYVLLNWEFYRRNPVEIFSIWSGGLIFYGGLALAAAVSVFYLKGKKIPIFQFADITAPAVFLGMAIGRIGCFFAGCCYGKPCGLPWAATFSSPLSFAPRGEALHPTQLYEALFCFALSGALDVLNRDRPFKKNFDGETFFVSLAVYGLWRFFIEFLRGDDRGSAIFGLFPSQFISILGIVAALGFIIYLWQKKSAK